MVDDREKGRVERDGWGVGVGSINDELLGLSGPSDLFRYGDVEGLVLPNGNLLSFCHLSIIEVVPNFKNETIISFVKNIKCTK